VHVGEARHDPVAESEQASLAELIETMLRGEAHRNPGQEPRELTVDVGVHEVRVERCRSNPSDVTEDAKERNRVDVGGERDRVQRHTARAPRRRAPTHSARARAK